MTQSTATTTIVFTDSDLRNLARLLFSSEVQGSRLDLESYDMDTTRQAFWAKEAEQYVEGWLTIRRASGEQIDFRRVKEITHIPFGINPVIPSLQEQAASLFEDTSYTWTGATFVKTFAGHELSEPEDLTFLYFQGRNAAGDIVWMDANGMDELSQSQVDRYLAEAA